MFRELPPRSPGQPRPLTPDMIADAGHAGRMMRIMGIVWSAVGAVATTGLAVTSPNTPPTLLYSVLAICLGGLALWAWGRSKRSRLLELFRTGDETRGEVVSVERDYTQKINGKRPWKLRYRYEVAGARHGGAMTYWTDDPPAGLEPGRAVIVLHAPGNAGSSLLWAAATPPLPDPGETHARARLDDAAWRDDPYARGEAQADGGLEAQAAAEARAESGAEAEAEAEAEAAEAVAPKRSQV